MPYFLIITAHRSFILEAADRAAASGTAPMLMCAEEDHGVRVVPLEAVATVEAAHDHFAALVAAEDYKDNYRSAYQADANAMREYEAAVDRGCCGSADKAYLVGGFNAYWIGCNYGH